MKNLILSISVLLLFLVSNGLSAQSEINTTKEDKATNTVKVDVYENGAEVKEGVAKPCSSKSNIKSKSNCVKPCCAKSKTQVKSRPREKANVKSRTSCKPGCAKTCKHKN